MSLRISSAALAALLLAACGPESPTPEGAKVECAIGSTADFAQVCTLERSENSAGFVIHHPDGGFRRIEYDPQKDELGVLGGADPLSVSAASTSEITEFAIGDDRYRVPSVMLRAARQ